MLVLDRKKGEGVYIGRGVRITILEVTKDAESGAQVIRLGIEAPRHIAVSRDDFTFEQHMKFQLQRSTSRPDL